MQKFCVWTTHSLDRVRKTRTPQENYNFALCGAKGEYESFQIVIHAMDEPLCIKNITFTEFSKNGEKLCDNIDIYREHYISFDKKSMSSGESTVTLFLKYSIPPLTQTNGKKGTGSETVRKLL